MHLSMNFVWMNKFVFWVTVSLIVTRTSYSTEIACLFFLFLNPIEKKLLDVTLGRHGMLYRQHIFIEEFFHLLKKTFPHNWISILDVEMAFLTLKRKLKLKIKFKNYFLVKPFYLIQIQCCSKRTKNWNVFFSFNFFQLWLHSIQLKGVGIRTHNCLIVSSLSQPQGHD